MIKYNINGYLLPELGLHRIQNNLIAMQKLINTETKIPFFSRTLAWLTRMRKYSQNVRTNKSINKMKRKRNPTGQKHLQRMAQIPFHFCLDEEGVFLLLLLFRVRQQANKNSRLGNTVSSSGLEQV